MSRVPRNISLLSRFILAPIFGSPLETLCKTNYRPLEFLWEGAKRLFHSGLEGLALIDAHAAGKAPSLLTDEAIFYSRQKRRINSY